MTGRGHLLEFPVLWTSSKASWKKIGFSAKCLFDLVKMGARLIESRNEKRAPDGLARKEGWWCAGEKSKRLRYSRRRNEKISSSLVKMRTSNCKKWPIWFVKRAQYDLFILLRIFILSFSRNPLRIFAISDRISSWVIHFGRPLLLQKPTNANRSPPIKFSIPL